MRIRAWPLLLCTSSPQQKPPELMRTLGAFLLGTGERLVDRNQSRGCVGVGW